jgi:hypothetical protein
VSSNPSTAKTKQQKTNDPGRQEVNQPTQETGVCVIRVLEALAGSLEVLLTLTPGP